MKRIFSNGLAAFAAGLGLRFFFVLKFPAESGDAVLYEQIASNWLKYHIYGMDLGGAVVPVDLRMPGYPGFLGLLYALTGKMGRGGRFGVMFTQVLVDLVGCLVIAGLAALLAARAERADKVHSGGRRVFAAGLWLAALCPFTANYTAVVMTEVFAVFLTGLALAAFVFVSATFGDDEFFAYPVHRWCTRFPPERRGAVVSALGGFFVGWATLFRPESPLLLLVAWIVLLALARKHKILYAFRLCVISGVACVLPLLPWAIRNAVTLHEMQLLAPRYSNLPGELVPYGFMGWERTWLYRMRDCYVVPWKLDEEAIHVEDIPARAFDTPEEKARVAGVLEEYNHRLTLTVEEDRVFGELARERTSRYPFRTYLRLPAARSLTLWFSPRIELVPLSGEVFPLRQAWRDDPIDQSLTIGFFLLNMFYVALAGWGAVRLWRYREARAPVALLAAFIVLRTAFLTTLETPEPRYVLVCFPAVLALAAQVFVRRHGREQKPADSSALRAARDEW